MNKLFAFLILVLITSTSVSNKEVVVIDNNGNNAILELIRAENRHLSDSIQSIAIETTVEVVVLDSVVGKLENNGKDQFYEFAKREKELVAEIRRLKGY